MPTLLNLTSLHIMPIIVLEMLSIFSVKSNFILFGQFEIDRRILVSMHVSETWLQGMMNVWPCTLFLLIDDWNIVFIVWAQDIEDFWDQVKLGWGFDPRTKFSFPLSHLFSLFLSLVPFYLSGVNGIVHHCGPSFESSNLEKSEVGTTYVVKVDPGVGPVEVVVEAGLHVVNDGRVHDVSFLIDALDIVQVKLSLNQAMLCL